MTLTPVESRKFDPYFRLEFFRSTQKSISNVRLPCHDSRQRRHSGSVCLTMDLQKPHPGSLQWARESLSPGQLPSCSGNFANWSCWWLSFFFGSKWTRCCRLWIPVFILSPSSVSSFSFSFRSQVLWKGNGQRNFEKKGLQKLETCCCSVLPKIIRLESWPTFFCWRKPDRLLCMD